MIGLKIVINSEVFVREGHTEDIGNVRNLFVHPKTDCNLYNTRIYTVTQRAYNTRILWLLDRQLPLCLCRRRMQKNTAKIVINSEKMFVRESHTEDIGNVRSLKVHLKTKLQQQTRNIQNLTWNRFNTSILWPLDQKLPLFL